MLCVFSLTTTPCSLLSQFTQANADLFNFLSYAAVLRAVIHPEGTDAILPHLTFNTDVTTLLLGEAKAGVLVTPAGAQYLREHHLNVAETRTVHQQRTIAIMPTVAADGTLVCTLLYVHDFAFKEPHLYLVCISS